MRVEADRDVCVGSGSCVFRLDAVFDQDDDGLVIVRLADPPDALREEAEIAARVCPSGAITVRDGT
ncbi:ferredoxin [Streptomyces sp. NPDC059894]|uniref:ferredoxin n=1 Tax=unclassified Streptomyces TaxID=2593676 RepID=UPI00364B8922